LLLAFGVLLDPGDEVLLADPGYPCNRHFVRTLGAVPRAVPVGPASRYQLTPELARRHWSEKTRMAMVASPANPTGTLVTPEEVAGLAALAREKNGSLLADEIYHGLTYGLDARSAARSRAPHRGARAEPLHLALDGGAARGARVLHAGNHRDPRAAPRRARPAPPLPHPGAAIARLRRAGGAGGRVLHLRRFHAPRARQLLL